MSEPKIDDFFRIIDKTNYQNEYKNMFVIPDEDRNTEVNKDKLEYTECIWDTQGSFVCKNWKINKQDGYAEINK